LKAAAPTTQLPMLACSLEFLVKDLSARQVLSCLDAGFCVKSTAGTGFVEGCTSPCHPQLRSDTGVLPKPLASVRTAVPPPMGASSVKETAAEISRSLLHGQCPHQNSQEAAWLGLSGCSPALPFHHVS